MSQATVSVPVPASGEGAAVDISSLVGQKTVQLSGQFSGYYDLLASQDGSEFVAVASFNAGGSAQIEQTISGAFSQVKLSSNAAQITPISCSVTGVVGAGQNHFATVASLGAGFSGLTPIIDTWALFPPTGVEEDICFLCRGAFQGPVIVLGSADGTDFNPVGQFAVDRLPEGAPAEVEFSPLATVDLVRYVRLQVPGITTGAVAVTIGGRIPASGGGGGGDSIAIVVDGSGNPYYFQGAVASSPLADLLGNTVGSNPASTLVAGDQIVVGNNASGILAQGSQLIVADDATGTVVLGAQIGVVGNPNRLVAIGSRNLLVLQGAFDPEVTLVGQECSITGTCPGTVFLGRGWQQSTDWSAGTDNYDHCCVVIGNGAGLANNATFTRSVLIGNPTVAGGADLGFLVGIGGATINSPNCIVIGESQVNATTSDLNVVIGQGSRVNSVATGTILIGLNIVCNQDWTGGTNNPNHLCVVIGNGGGVANNATFTRSVLIGNPTVAGGADLGFLVGIGGATINSPNCIVIGESQVNATTSALNVVIGQGSRVNSVATGAILIGPNIVCNQDWTGGTNNPDHLNVVIGRGDGIDANAQFFRSVVIGVPTLGAGGSLDRIVNVGDSTISVSGTANGLLSVVGFDNTAVGAQTAVFGNSNTLGDGPGNVHVFGSANTVGAGNQYVTAIGDQCFVATDSVSLVLIGTGNATTTAQQSSVVAIGVLNTVQGGLPNGHPTGNIVSIGAQNSIGTALGNSYNIVAIGANLGTSTTGVSLIVLGDGSSVGGVAATRVQSIGSNNNLNDGSDIFVGGSNHAVGNNTTHLVCIGDGNTVGNTTAHLVCVGDANTAGTACTGVVIGQGHALDNSSIAITVGYGSLISAGAGIAIAIGWYVAAGPNQCVIGNNNGALVPNPAINLFDVQGVLPSGAPGITFSATSQPGTPGYTGLSCVVNNGGTYNNRAIQAAVSPPVGSLLLYVAP